MGAWFVWLIADHPPPPLSNSAASALSVYWPAWRMRSILWNSMRSCVRACVWWGWGGACGVRVWGCGGEGGGGAATPRLLTSRAYLQVRPGVLQQRHRHYDSYTSKPSQKPPLTKVIAAGATHLHVLCGELLQR
jgi:hypothetical protein